MAKYIDAEEALDEATLQDWYLNSIDNTALPVWTEEHIYELCNDFIVIPKEAPAADVIQCQRINGADLRHPNEKPLDLMRRLIEATTKPNDLILDPFAGSGTTLVAALQSGRRYIGVELSPQHYETAQRRLYEAAFAVK